MNAMPGLLERCAKALDGSETLLALARERLSADLMHGGRADPRKIDGRQYEAHCFAWYATYCAALRALLDWARRLQAANGLSDCESLILQVAYGEYLAQMQGGIPMSQSEIARWRDLGLQEQALAFYQQEAVQVLLQQGSTPASRAALSEMLVAGAQPRDPLGDETLEMVREQFRRFAEEKIAPHAQQWHREDALIPLPLLEEMASLGVFGLTIRSEDGGVGLGKVAMCVVTEELSRASLAVGSLATRSEIAAELIHAGGTPAQRQRWLPAIASGSVIPTAVFTEPNTGSDLASVRTRAVRDGQRYLVTGNKTWITHAARADLMTMLVRTGAVEDGYQGLSIFLAEKPRGDDRNPFPVKGMSGTEIHVLGYRGMREYELAFDNFEVDAEGLLGAAEGQGFKQLMSTFESARIQTAARSVGVAQRALELAIGYARERIAFSRPIAEFQRVSGKIAVMAVEVMLARQLAQAAARHKDSGRRCDVEAGMAKLLAARVAWSNADCNVQIHGGNGYAEEYEASRILVDARILNIFEGAAEIQAQVVARGLLDAAAKGG